MTESMLDELRTHAERLADEANRFQRALKGSNANEHQAREHLANVTDAAEKCWLAGLRVAVVAEPPAAPSVPVVVDDTERAIEPPVEVRTMRRRK